MKRKSCCSKKLRLKVLFYVVGIIVLIGGSIGVIMPEIDAAEVDDMKVVKEINDRIHKSISYGIGTGQSSSSKEVLEYGEGHCGDYAYLMVKELRKKGYEARMVGIASSYYDGMHTRVEVKIDDKWYIFDPTFNIAFPNSTMEIIKKPDLIKLMEGIPSDESKYNKEEFFKGVQLIEYTYDIDNRDNNLSKVAKVKSDLEFEEGYEANKSLDQDSITFTAANSYVLPQSMKYTFEQEYKIYRIKIKWYSPEISGKSFKIEYMNEKGQYKTICNEKNYVDPQGDGVYEYILSKPITTKEIRFTLEEAYEQSRILIREFMIFED